MEYDLQEEWSASFDECLKKEAENSEKVAYHN